MPRTISKDEAKHLAFMKLSAAKKTLDKALNTDCLEEIIKHQNSVFKLIEIHKKDIKNLCDKQDFSPIYGFIDFNEWAHDQLYDLNDIWHDINAHRHHIAFITNGYTAF